MPGCPEACVSRPGVRTRAVLGRLGWGRVTYFFLSSRLLKYLNDEGMNVLMAILESC